MNPAAYFTTCFSGAAAEIFRISTGKCSLSVGCAPGPLKKLTWRRGVGKVRRGLVCRATRRNHGRLLGLQNGGTHYRRGDHQPGKSVDQDVSRRSTWLGPCGGGGVLGGGAKVDEKDF